MYKNVKNDSEYLSLCSVDTIPIGVFFYFTADFMMYFLLGYIKTGKAFSNYIFLMLYGTPIEPIESPSPGVKHPYNILFGQKGN